jgi:radical SAM protein with 4Fe4S-binding SPASM domain
LTIKVECTLISVPIEGEIMFSVKKKVSYQFYDDFCIIIDHAKSCDYKLNSVASSIFKKIVSKQKEFVSDELEFIDELIEAGIVSRDGDSYDQEEVEYEKRSGLNSSVWEELNEYAAHYLIPVSAIAELTYNCPLECRHCYIDRSEVKKNEELSLLQYMDFIDQFRELGGLYLTLTGGDPFLHRDFEEIFNYARTKKIAVSIMSSGFNCDPEMIKRMAGKGVESFQLSIYGHNSKIHDSFTGIPGSFEQAVNTLRTFKQNGVYVQAAVIVTNQNIDSFDEIITFLENEKIRYVLNHNIFPKRNGDKTVQGLNITKEQLQNCLNKTGVPGKPRLFEKKDNDPVCNTARSLFSINPVGTIYPCIEIRIPAGSIKNEQLDKIWNKSKILNQLRNIKIRDLEDCPQCKLREFCNRCTGTALKEGLSIAGHSNFDCLFAEIKSNAKI